MGWEIKSVMEQKEQFIKEWESGAYYFNSLCEHYGISRTAGYKLIEAYQKYGSDIYAGRSKRPSNSPNKTPQYIEDSIILLRTKHKNWGARKIKKLLEAEYDVEEIPSAVTINAILKRNNLITAKRRRYKKSEKLYPKFDPDYCNEIWSSDYKGKFKIGNGRYCHALTVCDSKSRKILGIHCHYRATYTSVKQSYIKIFREYGLPEYLHTDNGSPFGNVRAIRRYSRLCYWLIDQGVYPVFSDPGCPQQNGRHERMHRDLKAYIKPRLKTTLSKQQRVLDAFKEEYNKVRPHESLGMDTPAEHHVRSEREYKERKSSYEYPMGYKVLKVTRSGSIRWGGYHWVYISRAAIGLTIGLEELGNGVWNVYYRDVILGCFDEKELMNKEQYLKLTEIKV